MKQVNVPGLGIFRLILVDVYMPALEEHWRGIVLSQATLPCEVFSNTTVDTVGNEVFDGCHYQRPQ